MQQERKILPVVRTFSSFQEAEDADDEYWANTTEVERLTAIIDLRKIFINHSDSEGEIQKVVIKHSIYEEAG